MKQDACENDSNSINTNKCPSKYMHCLKAAHNIIAQYAVLGFRNIYYNYMTKNMCYSIHGFQILHSRKLSVYFKLRTEWMFPVFLALLGEKLTTN